METLETFEFILLSLFLSSFWCFGFGTVIDKLLLKEIIRFDTDTEWDHLYRWQKLILKPLYACTGCMASVHGTIIFFTFLQPLSILWWMPFIFMLSGLNVILSHLVNE